MRRRRRFALAAAAGATAATAAFSAASVPAHEDLASISAPRARDLVPTPTAPPASTTTEEPTPLAVEASAPVQIVEPVPASPTGAGSTPTEGPLVAAPSEGGTLACIRRYESDTSGGYQADNGVDSGAYQFEQATWDGVVARAGHPEWAGRRAADAPPAVQDAAAEQLVSERGLQPWPTPAQSC